MNLRWGTQFSPERASTLGSETLEATSLGHGLRLSCDSFTLMDFCLPSSKGKRTSKTSSHHILLLPDPLLLWKPVLLA